MSMSWSPESAANAYMDALKLVSGFIYDMNHINSFEHGIIMHDKMKLLMEWNYLRVCFLGETFQAL